MSAVLTILMCYYGFKEAVDSEVVDFDSTEYSLNAVWGSVFS